MTKEKMLELMHRLDFEWDSTLRVPSLSNIITFVRGGKILKFTAKELHNRFDVWRRYGTKRVLYIPSSDDDSGAWEIAIKLNESVVNKMIKRGL